MTHDDEEMIREWKNPDLRRQPGADHPAGSISLQFSSATGMRSALLAGLPLAMAAVSLTTTASPSVTFGPFG